MTHDKNISFRTEGSSELSRYRSAINPAFFGIDERSLSDILSFMLEYAKNVRYKNFQNQAEGNWSVFFENNLAFVIATISSKNLDTLHARFQQAIDQINNGNAEGEKTLPIKTLIEVIHELFAQVDNWYKLSRHDLIHLEENKLAEHLKNAISMKLASQRHNFESLILGLNNSVLQSNPTEISFDAFDTIWYRTVQSETPFISELKWVVRELSRIYKSIFSVITYLRNLAPRLLDDTLENYPYHSAHISLLIAFVKAFHHVQEDANQLTKRHLDYYYTNILKQSLRPSKPDKVHVYFEPAEHIVKSVIPEGTLLSAGVDTEGVERTYITTQQLELNQAKITEIKNIHVAQNPIIGVGNTYNSVSNIYSRDVKIDGSGNVLDKANNPASIDTFGKDQADTSWIQRDMDQAKIGFALSSSVLLLKEGERKIRLKYTFNLSSLTSLISFIEELTQKEKLSPENAFYKLLNNIFSVRYTSDIGWVSTESYEILPPQSWTSGEIMLEVLLDVADPPMLPLNTELHGTEYSTQWPVLEFMISSQHAMYSYSYLKDLLVEQCEIEVVVNKAKDLFLFNDLGKLDISKPFYPFGSTPDLGSYFLLGNEELMTKNISEVSIDIHWHNLPKQKGGFTSYYKDYPGDIATDQFKVGITYLSDFRFHPLEEADVQTLALFEEDNTKKTLKDEKRFDKIDLEKLEFKPNYTLSDLTDYTSKTRSGFFKFEVLGPSAGFGHSEYPKLFATAVLENSKSAGLLSKESKKMELPNQPFAPQIRAISLNYSAKALLVLNVNRVSENDKVSKDQVYHIHPFGNKIAFDNGLPQSNSLVPQFDDEGYLFLGIDKIQAPVELSLYFQLEDNIKNETHQVKIPKAKWKYLVEDEWVDFNENELVHDGTHNFTTSGIVKLKIPSLINKNHRILPSGKYWLGVSTAFNSELLSKIALIQTNALEAIWRAHKAGEQWEQNIQGGTIAGLVETRSDVVSVNQPYKSVGGRAAENKAHFYTRVSERLKHKMRAVTPEDYEKIILDRFPFLFQVKCINHFSHPEFVKKGSIKLIVVPKLEQHDTFYAPKVNYNQLQKIQHYIKRVASPYTQIEVLNPSYETVKVSCKVVMKNSTNAGEYVKKLETDLRKFICPWFDTHQGDMKFGGGIERDDILTFIERLDYVNFITKLSVIIIHQVEGKYDISDSAANEGKANELQSSRPWSVLVPSANHAIELIDKPAYELAKETRIETMKIGDDFVIIDEKESETAFPYFDLDKDTFYAIEIEV